MSFIDIKKIIFRFSYIKQRGFTRAHNVLITRSRFRSNSFILSFIVSYLYIIQRICKRTNFGWIMRNASISNCTISYWEWEFEEGQKMVAKKMFNIVYRFSYIKQQIERGFTRVHNALITRSNTCRSLFLFFSLAEVRWAESRGLHVEILSWRSPRSYLHSLTRAGLY